MNKKDIKPGVEYAITNDPGAIERNILSAGKLVTKARVVNIEGKGERYVQSGYGRTYAPRLVTGIEIEQPETVKGQRHVYEDGSPKKDATGRGYEVEDFEVTYPTRFLKNARYILSTWEEWEQRIKRAEDAKAERDRAAIEAAQARTDADPGKRAMAMRVFQAIEKATGQEVVADLSDRTYTGRAIRLSTGMLLGTVEHDNGVNQEDVIVGIKFTFDLTTLAKLLGVHDA